MKIKSFVLTTIFTFAYSSFAMAGTLFNEDPFNGLYIGGHGGYGFQDDTVRGDAAPFGGAEEEDNGSDGGTYGAFGGLGFTLGTNFYVGLEGQYNIVNRDSSQTTFDGVTPFNTSTDHEWNVGGRVGWVFGGSTLVFVRGAYSELTVDIQSGATPLEVDTLDGWQAGLGAEYAFGPHFTLRGEYVYSNYSDGDIINTAVTPSADAGNFDSASGEGRLALTFEF